MFSRPGYAIGDAWLFADGDTVHLFYLTTAGERTGLWDIGHAVSDDLVNWDYLGLALERGAPGEWDALKLATGSIIQRDGRYWMAYTGHPEDHRDLAVQWVGMAASNDLITWEKQPGNPVTKPDPRWYEEVPSGQRPLAHWRDPFLLDLGDEVLCFTCARSLEGPVETRGTVSVSTSTDLRDWTVGPPLDVPRFAEELEVPQVYRVNGRWYLVFCTHPHLLDPVLRERFPGHPWRSADYCFVADDPRGPYRVDGTGEILPPGSPVRPYASQLVEWRGTWYLLGTVRGDGPDAICDPLALVADATGLHPAG